MNKRVIYLIAAVILVLALTINAGAVGYGVFTAVVALCACNFALNIVRAIPGAGERASDMGRVRTLKIIALFMGLFFLTGTLIFLWAYPIIGTRHHAAFNNAELFLRSMISSLDLFMLDVDSNVLDRLDKDPFIKGAIVVQAALSFSCTVILLVSFVYSRVKAYCLLHWKTKVSAGRNHLYVFFGLDENSKNLAKDIGRKDPAALILLADSTRTPDDENSNSWENIVSMFTHRQKTFESADEVKAVVELSSREIYDLDRESLGENTCDILRLVDLNKIKELIVSLKSYPKDGRLYLFILSDDEDNNIRSLINLAKDRTILSAAEHDKIECKIFCHARYNGPNRVVEDLAVRKGLEVEIVDSSHLAVELLKATAADQPVRTVRLSDEYPTTVTSQFRALIIGFGEVGRDVFRFLYEFGTFIRIADGKAVTARPRIKAIDSEMKNLDGVFMANTTGIEYGPEGCELLEIDCRSHRFYEELLDEKACRELNYIVLALGDDDLNIAMATNIFNLIRRHRADMSHLIIMVRCVKREKVDLLQKVADHYNKGCGEKDLNVIRLFGDPEKIYSYDTIIKDSLTEKGKKFMESYLEMRGEPKTWDTRRSELTGAAERKPGRIHYPNLDKLRKLRRQESQDLANALHISTKMWLLRKALGRDCDLRGFLSRYFGADGKTDMHGMYGGIHFPCLDSKENEIILYLAMLEHARWNAAHELLGYRRNVSDHKCDEREMRHNCLTEWDELDNESRLSSSADFQYDFKSYDYCVINTTIKLAINNLKPD